jgi:hypothetical protein
LSQADNFSVVLLVGFPNRAKQSCFRTGASRIFFPSRSLQVRNPRLMDCLRQVRPVAHIHAGNLTPVGILSPLLSPPSQSASELRPRKINATVNSGFCQCSFFTSPAFPLPTS